jgi:glycosyltransferase involved in cell wall biosynthesis
MSKWFNEMGAQVLHSYNSEANIWGLFINLVGKKNWIAGEHGSVWTVRAPMSWLSKLAYDNADAVVANSLATKHMLNLRYHIPYEKITVVPNMVPMYPKVDTNSLRHNLGLDDAKVIGSVGRLSAVKNFKVLVDCGRIVLKKRKDVKFVLVGGGIQYDYLKEYIEFLGLENRFIITGWRSDARNILGLFDVFVCTSIQESFGNSLVEASLAGKPVVAPNIDGIPEIVKSGINGELLVPRVPFGKDTAVPMDVFPRKVLVGGELSSPMAIDPEELALTLLKLISDSETRVRYGRTGKRLAIRRFSLKRYLSRIMNVYEHTSRNM